MVKDVITFNSVIEFIRKFGQVDLEKTPVRTLAEDFKDVTSVGKECTEVLDYLKPPLIREEVLEFFPEEGVKVIMTEGKSLTEVDEEKLFDYLFKAGRMWDFVKISSVTLTSLRSLSDGEVLVKMFSKNKGYAASSCSVKNMTREEKIAEEAKRRQSL